MPHTLLLADDSVTIQRLVELTFADQNITVVSVGNGDQALDAIRKSPPDIVLADVGMPGLSGYDVARHIKHTPDLARIPVLLLTGAFEPIDHARASEAGCDGVLIKPFEPQMLIDRVKALLSVARAVAPVEPMPVASADEPRTGATARLDDYFDQLDQAIAARAVESPDRPVFFSPFESVTEPEAVADVIADTVGDAAGDGVALVATPGVLAATPPADTSVWVHQEPLLTGAFSALLAAEQSGAVPDAFADWLPEEPAPTPVPSVVQSAPAEGDELIDAAVQRVLGRLSETVVRDAVQSAVQSAVHSAVDSAVDSAVRVAVHVAVQEAVKNAVEDAIREAVRAAVLDIASETAERLVREEIARIKSNIK